MKIGVKTQGVLDEAYLRSMFLFPLVCEKERKEEEKKQQIKMDFTQKRSFVFSPH